MLTCCYVVLLWLALSAVCVLGCRGCLALGTVMKMREVGVGEGWVGPSVLAESVCPFLRRLSSIGTTAEVAVG